MAQPAQDIEPESVPAAPPRVPTRGQALLVWASSGALTFFVSGVVAVVASLIALWSGYDSNLIEDVRRSPLFVDPTWVALGSLPVQLTLLGCVAGWVYFLRPSLRAVLPMQRPRFLGLVGTLLLVGGLWPFAGVVAELAYRALEPDVVQGELLAAAVRRASGPQLLLLLLVLTVFPAVGEEAMFRGLITAPFRSAWAAVFIPAVLFGLIHFDPVAIAGTTVLGVGFGISRIYTGSLVAPMLAHGLYNAAVLTTARYAGVSHEIEVWPLIIGGALGATGFCLLHRERLRSLVRERERTAPSGPERPGEQGTPRN